VVGTIVSDNPILRLGAFGDGHANQLQYSLNGGGESYGFFGSFSALNEHGTTAGSDLNHRSGRSNFQWTPTETVAFEAGVGVSRADDKLPQGDQSSYGYLINGGFGSPTSVSTGANGQVRGGLLNNNLNVNAISAIKTENVTLRSTPSARLRYAPVPWFTHRVTLGADFVRTSAFQQYPKNDSTWYSTSLNTGAIARSEINSTVYTVDYLGNINRQFRAGSITSDLSFGSQWINSVTEALNGAGLGLLVNSNNVVSAATTSTVSQAYDQSKSFGLLAQEQIGFRDRLFLQVGARWDRNSAFNEKLGSFFLPKAGVSYVVSQEPAWQQHAPSWFSTLRLRTAYGETGRSPSSTASLQTYGRANVITDAGAILPGVTPGSPGNAELKPERGTEIEAGFDAAFFRDRVGVELTYFNKTSRDLLLALPLAPSSGFSSAPLVNIGKMTNKGLEIALRATPVERQNFTWNTGVNLNTLRNRIVSMGSVTPFVSANNQCFKPNVEVAAWCVLRVVRVDSAAGRAIVSDTAEVVGGQLPKVTSNWNTTLTLFRRVTLYGLFDGKWGHRVYNLTDDLRDRSLRNSKGTVAPADQGGYGAVERLRRLGPFVTATSGTAIGAPSVRGDYIESGDFVRLRELSATILIPPALLQQMRVASASLSVGGSNLKLWTKYGGFDPEVIGVVDPVTPYFAEVFTTPIARRVFVRVNFQF
jgi:hypothetical protein